MPILRPLSAVEQVAVHLRTLLKEGHWTGTMPGAARLSAELGVNHKTIEAALRQLEHEGLLEGQGQGRKRLIVQKEHKTVRPLKVAILIYESSDPHVDYLVELHHALMEAGHDASFTSRSMTELKMNVTRIAQLVKQTTADAWVVLSGSREVLQWFCTLKVPVFALFGRHEGLPIAAAGADKRPAISAATSRLIRLGHRRIVLLSRRERRVPEPGRTERAFLDEMKAHGLPTSEYNLPDWEESIAGYQTLLSSLFKITPPTAIIVQDAQFLFTLLQIFSRRGLRVPEQASIFCTDDSPFFTWCQPSISLIRWDFGPIVRRVVRWAANVSRGSKDMRQILVPAKFIEGGTIGPAPANIGIGIKAQG